MLTAQLLFTISFGGILFMLFNKFREIHKGEALFSVSHSTNEKIKQFSDKTIAATKRAPVVVYKTALFLAVKGGVMVFEKTKAKVYPRIAHLVDAVKGKHIPKNKGSASFFLNNIKEHKESQKKFEI